MSHGKPLTCLRCGAPIPSGFECVSCAAPRVSHATAAQGDPPAEPERSDGPKLAVASVLALLMVGVLVYGGISGSASMGRETAEAARKQAAREARHAKEEADRKAAAEQSAVAAQAQSDAQADAARQERRRKDAQDLADLKADAGLNVPPPSTPSPTTPAATTIQCALCHGTGTLTERCDRCSGDGEIECGHCETYDFRFNRGGDPSCPECGGASHRVSARGSRAGGVAFVYTCPKCHGTKETTKKCPYCHGTGTTSA